MYQTGDVVLCKANNIPSFMMRIGYFIRHGIFTHLKASRITHTATFLNTAEIVEAISPKVTRRYMPYTKDVEVWRRKTVKNFNAIENELLKWVNQPYAWYSLAVIMVVGLFRLEFLFKGIGKNGGICSEVTQKAHLKDGYDFNPQKASDFTTPYDIAKDIYKNPQNWERIL